MCENRDRVIKHLYMALLPIFTFAKILLLFYSIRKFFLPFRYFPRISSVLKLYDYSIHCKDLFFLQKLRATLLTEMHY